MKNLELEIYEVSSYESRNVIRFWTSISTNQTYFIIENRSIFDCEITYKLTNSGKLETMANFDSLVTLRYEQCISVPWIHFGYRSHSSVLPCDRRPSFMDVRCCLYQRYCRSVTCCIHGRNPHTPNIRYNL